MARIIVQSDDGRSVLLDEKALGSKHLDDAHSAAQLLERLRWAIADAEARAHAAARRRRRRAVILPRQSALERRFD